MAQPTILAADDDDTWRELLSAWMKEKGYNTHITDCGKKVLPLAEEHHPDLIILDFDLGDCKGSEVCARIKAHPKLGKTPVIILTNFPAALPKVLAEGRPDQFVVKNKDPFELMATLELLLSTA